MKKQSIFQIYFLLFATLHVNCQNIYKKRDEAKLVAVSMLMDFYTMFYNCIMSPMPDQNFLTDHLNGFVNQASKTTVGFAPKFTSHRKFFANMITTTAFKDMLSKDVNLLRRSLVDKLKYCDEAVMDQELLKDFYDRESDQSKI